MLSAALLSVARCCHVLAYVPATRRLAALKTPWQSCQQHCLASPDAKAKPEKFSRLLWPQLQGLRLRVHVQHSEHLGCGSYLATDFAVEALVVPSMAHDVL